MKNTIPLIMVAIFSITLLFSVNIMNFAYAVTIDWYDVDTSDFTLIMRSDTGFRRTVVECLFTGSALEGRQVNQISMPVSRSSASSANGNLFFGVWPETDTTPTNTGMIYTFGNVSYNDLDVGLNLITLFNNASDHTLQDTDCVGVYTSVTTQSVVVFTDTTDPFDGLLTGGYNWIFGGSFNANGMSTTDHKMTISFNDGTETPSSSGIDCSLPENFNILICRIGGDGTLGSAGAFVIGNATEGTGLLGIGCGIGIVDCTEDTNPRTNGLGLLVFISSIFVVVGMFVSTQGMQNTIKLPLYMWAVIIIALSAFFTITQIIDPVFLIISIIGLIALGAPKLINTFKGGSTFGSGSTE